MDGLNGTVTIRFSEGSYYDYESISLVCQPLQSQVEDLKRLENVQIESLKIEKGEVWSDVLLDKDGIVCFSIPYSKGWKAYVDGNKVDILKANEAYMALKLDSGSHNIRFEYSTPFKSIGLITSLVSFVGLCGYICYEMIRSHRKVKRNEK